MLPPLTINTRPNPLGYYAEFAEDADFHALRGDLFLKNACSFSSGTTGLSGHEGRIHCRHLRGVNMEWPVEITDGSRGPGHRRVLQPHCICGDQQTEYKRCQVIKQMEKSTNAGCSAHNTINCLMIYPKNFSL